MPRLSWQVRLALWWRRVLRCLSLQRNKLRTMRRVRQIPQLQQPASAALQKVYRSCPHIPPDTVSAGIQNGGDALFFKHEGAIEIFIGKSHDHAADELIAWIKRQGDEVKTSNKSQMSRLERRAYKAHYKREGRRRRRGA